VVRDFYLRLSKEDEEVPDVSSTELDKAKDTAGKATPVPSATPGTVAQNTSGNSNTGDNSNNSSGGLKVEDFYGTWMCQWENSAHVYTYYIIISPDKIEHYTLEDNIRDEIHDMYSTSKPTYRLDSSVLVVDFNYEEGGSGYSLPDAGTICGDWAYGVGMNRYELVDGFLFFRRSDRKVKGFTNRCGDVRGGYDYDTADPGSDRKYIRSDR